MAVLGNRASGIMDYIERMGSQFIPANMSPAQETPLQREMNRPDTQMAQNRQAMITTNPSGQMSTASPVTPPRMISEMKIPDMGGAGVRMPPEMMKKAEAASKVVEQIKQRPEIEQNPSFRKMASEFFGNRENMLRLALAFNTMRLQPDQGLAAALGSELKDIRETRVLNKKANSTLNALRQAGVPEKDLQVLADDPDLLRKYAVEFFKKKMGVDPADIQTFNRLTKGMSEEDIDRAKRIELGLEPRAGSQLALSLEQLFARSAAKAGGSEAGKSEQEKKALQVQNDKTWKIWQTAISGLEESLGNTATGRIAGLLPAITSNQQIADQCIAIMAPVLKNIFRESGEGVFTDKDQQILIDMIPDRGSNPDTIAFAIKQINDIVAAKLNQQVRVEIVPNAPTPNVLRFDSQGNPI